MTSEKQKDANRRNAQKSSGPQSDEGKSLIGETFAYINPFIAMEFIRLRCDLEDRHGEKGEKQP